MDFFCYPVSPSRERLPEPLFCIAGFYFIRKDVFERIGRFDECFFMYGEEMDISWRLWVCGEKIAPAFEARVHHRGAVGVNPDGGVKPTEFRTSESKRFYANRNHLVMIAKNGHSLLLLLLIPAIVLIALEALLALVLTRKASTFVKVGLAPIRDFFRHYRHIRNERRKLSAVRQHGDLWLIRFFRFRFGRSHEAKQILSRGFPKFGR
jgi:hypothetical protein